MNVAIITPGGITNFGERAIMLGTIYALRKSYGKKAQIVIFGYKNLRSEDPRLFEEITKQGVSFYAPIIHGKNRLIKLLRVIGIWFLPRLFLPRQSYDFLKNAAVYSKGQESFTQDYGLVHFVDSFLEQLLVSRLNNTVVLYGHSIGPVHKYKRIAAWAIKHFKKIYVRDARSHQVLLDLGYDKKRIEPIKDLAYTAVAHYPLGRQVKKKGHYLIVPNAAICKTATPQQTKQYLDNLKAILKTLLHQKRTVIIGSSVIHDGWNNDYGLCEQLKTEYKDLKLKHYRHLDEFLLDVTEAQKVISSRLHPLIMANGLGTPVLALSRSHKVKGLLGDVGLQAAVIDPFETLDKAQLQDL